MGRSRSRSRDKHRKRSRSRDRHRHRSRSRSRERHRDRRDRSVERRDKDRDRGRDRERERDRHRPTDRADEHAAPAAPAASGAEVERLKRLEAWKARQAASAAATSPSESTPAPSVPAPSAPATTAPAPTKVWMPWEDESLQGSDAAHAPGGAPSSPGAAFGVSDDEEEAAEAKRLQAEAAALARQVDPNYVPPAVAAKKAKAAAEEAARLAAAAAGEEEVDPLEAFMAASIMPEVAAREAEEQKRREDERRRIAEQLATGKAVKTLKELEEDSEEEPEPDLEIQVPTSRVKLVIGPGGSKISEISKKSKCRIQIKKEEKELTKAFGTGGKVADIIQKAQEKAGTAQGDGAGEAKLTTFMLYGDQKAVEKAERMIWEAVENKDQKQVQRQKEYERKREAKRRERLLYHLRHAKDYEMLELPMGASKVDIKKAYRALAIKWHPDKHLSNQEEAKAKFQAIQKAYESLMTTSEDDIIEQLADKSA